MTGQALLRDLRVIVGRRHVLRAPRKTLRFRRGFRSGTGEALAVVRPGSLVELWRVVQRLVAADVAIIMQAANTGLTGGSTPPPQCGRAMAIINVMRIAGIHLLEQATQVVCLPGTTLAQLEARLAPLGREPHSVIGSSCLGASVVGGICNNSGGSLIERGPAYTELSLFAHVGADGRLELVNRLGIALGATPEEMLHRLETGDFAATPAPGFASAPDYVARVRDIDNATPARFNADPTRLHDCSGSAGHLVVFAVRLDTFARAQGAATFYIGTNDPAELTDLRRRMLASSAPLPISAEYIHRDAFDIADRYGRDIFHAIRLLGTARLPALFALKARIDAVGAAIGLADLSDRLLHRLGVLLPDQLPRRMRIWRERYEHHLLLTVDSASLDSVRRLLETSPGATSDGWFECTAGEAKQATLHRFVVAGAAVRYLAIHRADLTGLVALDIALPRNARTWIADAPSSVARALHYGHFFCHVFHRDYLVATGYDPDAVKAQLLAALDAEGAEYPAEHNVGRQYRARPALADFYRQIDPTNRFNPGIGKLPVGTGWQEI
ncbi:D-lactate dehydrogenase [Novosphingobium capsulatum]|uniref:D-lactate dehydrogenase n=1 Tax=Novosphingobium capsulatum TaxID=13688 RepID=A0ABU1MMJ5_9SPHN|nr:D-lactate dehydrogenase [Novosphingobium capsulatum]MDR6511554.1 D-lactate dehydrogenase [Novosphingobium capsulatum]